MEYTPLKYHPYAQCGTYDYQAPFPWRMNERGFLSYKTRIIIIRGSRVIFTGYYSRTTSRQVTWYLNEANNGLTHKILDHMCKHNLAYNLKTQEFEALTEEELSEIKGIRKAAFKWGYGW